MKTGDAATHRGFESHPLRHILKLKRDCYTNVAVSFLSPFPVIRGRLKVLQRPKDTVTCITEAGYNVSVLIEAFVHGGNVDRHIRMVSSHATNALGR